MEQAGKKRLIAGASVAALALFGVAYSAIFSSHAGPLPGYLGELQVRAQVKAIKLPSGAEFAGMSSSHNRGVPFVIASYSYTDQSDFESVKAHYKQELARQGFTSRVEHDSAGKESLHFCAPGCAVTLIPINPDYGVRGYMLILGRNETPC
ncbi:MAG TPA: hypothetical protein VFL42_00670 [Terriglobales bacterium]|jgi:hypothetical protein|nr:hypothetical protein [Terriglobales bacterium]